MTKLSGTVAECYAALDARVAKEPEEMVCVLKGLKRNTLTWEHRAMGAFIFLHPAIYGEGDMTSRIESVGKALGVERRTVTSWFSLHDISCKKNTEKWLPLVKEMTWEDVSKCFAPCWAKQWNLDASATVKDRLGLYEQHIKGSKATFLSKHTPGTTTAGRKSAARRDSNTFVLKQSTKRLRTDVRDFSSTLSQTVGNRATPSERSSLRAKSWLVMTATKARSSTRTTWTRRRALRHPDLQIGSSVV